MRVAALPRSFPALLGQWFAPGLLTAYSCGGSNGLGASTALPHRIPFSSRTRALRTETVGATIFPAGPGVKGIPPNFTRNPAMRSCAVQGLDGVLHESILQPDFVPKESGLQHRPIVVSGSLQPANGRKPYRLWSCTNLDDARFGFSRADALVMVEPRGVEPLTS